MKKRLWRIFLVVCFGFCLLAAVGCGGGDDVGQTSASESSENPLIKDGYTLNETEEYYEKFDGDSNTVFVNFTKSEAYLSTSYSVTSDMECVVFEGKKGTEYYNFQIKIAKRESPVTVQLKNFSYTANREKIALDASAVSDEYEVSLIAVGTCKIVGGKSNAANNGASYSRSETADYARDGDAGADAKDGENAVKAKNLCLVVRENAEFTLQGGDGGKGGSGGNGEGSCGSGQALAGRGGKGGNGGNGGNAITIETSLTIVNDGELSLYGGKGGDGGNGGSGGHGVQKYETDQPDHGNNGGNGGDGGKGGAAICSKGEILLLSEEGEYPICVGGDGGKGGKGGDGGNGAKGWHFGTMYSDPGRGGYGGDGGAGGRALETTTDLAETFGENGKGGQGGKGGNGGSNGEDSAGGGASGVDGKTWSETAETTE